MQQTYETSFHDREVLIPETFEAFAAEALESGAFESQAVGTQLNEEALVAELAGELLEIGSEAELDQFLGKLARSVVKGASRFVRSPIGKALGGVLKTVAKTALPAVGGALGSMVAPGIGTMIGSRLGSLAGGLLEVGEAETMTEAEAEFEAARRYVRFARSAYAGAARAPRGLPPRAVVRAAGVTAARRHAPGLLTDRDGGSWRDRRRPPHRRRPPYSTGYRTIFRPLPWPYIAGNDGYDWPGYGGTGYPPPPYVAEPAPWLTAGDDPDGVEGAPGDDRESAPGAVATHRRQRTSAQQGTQAQHGQWVRRGRRVVVLGV